MNSFLNKYTLESNPELIDLDLPEKKKGSKIKITKKFVLEATSNGFTKAA